MEIPSLANLPRPSEKRIAIHVTPASERVLRNGHPWVFDQAIRKQSHEGKAGDLAVIFDKKRRFLAIGLYDPDSPIRVRVLHHHKPTTIDRAWFKAKLANAIDQRAPLHESDTNGYRLVYGENDGLPALIVDRYAETLVVKLYTCAWIPYLQDVIASLLELFPSERIVLRMSRLMQNTPELCYGLHEGQILWGDALDAPIVFTENGLRFSADVIQGHKTGFFFDHRENRARVRDLAQGKSVLDVFAYNGGFSLYSADGGASEVVSLDISRPALESAQANFALNSERLTIQNVHHEILVADAFEGLEKLHTDGRQFDLVIVDPPSFAKRQSEVAGALVAYAHLTELALDILGVGGILVMASCSSRVSAEAFYDIVLSTIDRAGGDYTELARTTHALDHPIGFPEGAYLKCLFLRLG